MSNFQPENNKKLYKAIPMKYRGHFANVFDAIAEHFAENPDFPQITHGDISKSIREVEVSDELQPPKFHKLILGSENAEEIEGFKAGDFNRAKKKLRLRSGQVHNATSIHETLHGLFDISSQLGAFWDEGLISKKTIDVNQKVNLRTTGSIYEPNVNSTKIMAAIVGEGTLLKMGRNEDKQVPDEYKDIFSHLKLTGEAFQELSTLYNFKGQELTLQSLRIIDDVLSPHYTSVHTPTGELVDKMMPEAGRGIADGLTRLYRHELSKLPVDEQDNYKQKIIEHLRKEFGEYADNPVKNILENPVSTATIETQY